MSFFLNNSIESQQEVDEEKIKMAEIQLAAQSQTYTNLLNNCRSKCIPHEYGENELNKGETVCVDRCVSKFFKVNLMIGQYVQQHKYANPANLPAYQDLPLNPYEQ